MDDALSSINVTMNSMKINRKFFFEQAKRTLFDGKLTQSQVDGLNIVLDEWERGYPNEDHRKLAYILASIHHETDRKMQPIEEYGKGKGKPYGSRIKYSRKPYTDTSNLFYGRGYTQNTWYEIYEKAGRKVGLDLIHHPELLLQPVISIKVSFLAMFEGWYTGAKLDRYFNATKEDWKGARAIINGSDKAELIKSYAIRYYACISMMPA